MTHYSSGWATTETIAARQRLDNVAATKVTLTNSRKDTNMTDAQKITNYLAENGYGDEGEDALEAWAADSDCTKDEDGQWYDEHGNPIDPGDYLLTVLVSMDEADDSRQNRTDLCADCKDEDHPACSLDAECSCCLTTMAAMEEGQ